ncbi:MAG TPA: sialate O-acetylesterase [Chitinophagaceae bacterium]
MKNKIQYACWLCLLLLSKNVFADVRLPAIISDNMVLQQKSVVALWGWADAGETIEIKNSWDNKTIKTIAAENGNWQLKLKTTIAGGPYTIVIKGNNTITLNNVLLGEVWLCSGQSNMEFPLGKQQGWRSGVFNYETELAAANYPRIRFFTVKQQVADAPQKDVAGNWTACTPGTAATFSAVAYYFAKEIQAATGFPVGLIHSSWGGTPAESWTRQDVLEGDSDLKPILDRYNKALANYPADLEKYETNLAQWKKEAEEIKLKGGTAKAAPAKPTDPLKNSKSPTKLYNAMIHPLIPYTLKGVIWYQGESNAVRAYQYRKLFPALINSWRKEWKNDFPFYFVQIAPYREQNPEIREAQLLTYKKIPKTGMVVIMDAGDSADIHPRNKEIVGKRLSLWPLANEYGKKNITVSGPVYKSMKNEGDKIRIQFDFAVDGLVAKDGALTEFSIAGADQQFIPAHAVIEKNTIVVWSDEIKKPVAVRFGWKNVPKTNLYNKAGLPASPFRTDDWPGETFGKN